MAHEVVKVYVSYEYTHKLVAKLAEQLKKFRPDYIVAIGGGGFIPARMLRTYLKIPILAVGIQLYDEATDVMQKQPLKTLWFDEQVGLGKHIRDHRVIVIDEMDDSRSTLEFCVKELQRLHNPSAIAVAVLHNKRKPKTGVLPPNVEYYCGEEIDDRWVVYAWEAVDIDEHQRLATHALTCQDYRIK